MSEILGSPAERSLADVLISAIRTSQAQVHTALPAKVIKYDAAKQVVDVQPAVKRPIVDSEGNETVESLPQITNVPVAFPRAGDNWLTFPIAAGDFVLLVFAERSIDSWRVKGEESDPQHLRMHSLADAVAIPGVYPSDKKLTTSSSAVVLNAAQELHLGGVDPDQFVALAQSTKNEISALRDTVNNFITTFNSHIHTTTATVGPSAVPGVIAPPVSPASPPAPVGDIAATKVKAV